MKQTFCFNVGPGNRRSSLCTYMCTYVWFSCRCKEDVQGISLLFVLDEEEDVKGRGFRQERGGFSRNGFPHVHSIKSVFNVPYWIFYKAFSCSTVALFFRKLQSALNGGVSPNEDTWLKRAWSLFTLHLLTSINQAQRTAQYGCVYFTDILLH